LGHNGSHQTIELLLQIEKHMLDLSSFHLPDMLDAWLTLASLSFSISPFGVSRSLSLVRLPKFFFACLLVYLA
jgi:hypothetical protein